MGLGAPRSFGYLVLLLCLAFPVRGAGLPPDVEQQLGDAAQRVLQSIQRFDRLRRDLASASSSTVARLVAGLSPLEKELLEGRGASAALEERFLALQSQGNSLLKSLREANASDASDASDSFSLLETKDVDPVDERPEAPEEEEEEEGEDEEEEETEEEGGDRSPDEDEEEEEDEDEVDQADERDEAQAEQATPVESEVTEAEKAQVESAEGDLVADPEEPGAERGAERATTSERCRSARNASGYILTEVSLFRANFSVSAACSFGFAGIATTAVCSGDDREYDLKGCVETCEAAPKLGYSVTEGSLALEDFQVAATCEAPAYGHARARRCPAPGEPYELSGCMDVPSFVHALGSLASELERHFDAMQALANLSALPPTAAAARAQQRLAEFGRAPRTARRAEALKRWGAAFARWDMRDPEHVEEFEALAREVESFKEELESTANPAGFATTAFHPARPSCDAAGLQRAQARHDAVLEHFRTVAPKMLPREVESLHRVLHSMEVCRNGLLRRDLGSELEASECQRYFSGIEQLESDLAHYRNLFDPPAPSAPAARGAPRASAVPLRPGQLEALEVVPLRGLGMSSPGSGPALDSTRFR